MRRAASHEGLGGMHDRVRVQPMQMVDIFHRSSLTEMLHAQRLHPVTVDAADP